MMQPWAKTLEEVLDRMNQLQLTKEQAYSLITNLEQLGGQLPSSRCPSCGVGLADHNANERIVEALASRLYDLAEKE